MLGIKVGLEGCVDSISEEIFKNVQNCFKQDSRVGYVYMEKWFDTTFNIRCRGGGHVS